MAVKGSPRFVPGDRVVVRSWESMADVYEMNRWGTGILCPVEYGTELPYCTFSDDRKRLCGTEVVIREALWFSEFKMYAYHIDDSKLGDDYFVETMFEVPGLSILPELPEIQNEDLAAFLSV